MNTKLITKEQNNTENLNALGLTPETMYRALVEKDAAFEGVFYAAVRTTGIFCKPTCTARKPKPENVSFYRDIQWAVLDGYRPCKVCRPMECKVQMPQKIADVLEEFHGDCTQRIQDGALRSKGIEPATVRRWFQRNYGMTFHAYQRMYRLNSIFTKLRAGEKVVDTAMDSGYDSLSGFGEMFKTIAGVSPNKGRALKILHITRIGTPLGVMIAGALPEGICLLEFLDRRMLETEFKYFLKTFNCTILPGENPHFDALEKQLTAYFNGKLKVFTVPLVISGSEFQKRAWQALMKIPYGTTVSYKKQAEKIGNVKGVRATANANGANRIGIIIPCHRVIGSDGNLHGYGGGVWRKRHLIDLEKKNAEA